ncbi:type II secretion system F family protein [Pirellulaceae bacterium]|jgi:tight adherence protein C|nr:type II secretion system F family protein [Pirellulaceae bacterium]
MFAEFDYSTYLPYAIFGAVAVGAWVVFDLFTNRSTSSERRLEKLSKRKSTVDLLDEQPSVSLAGFLEKASPSFSKAMQPQNEKDVDKLKHKLSCAGYRRDKAVPMFLTVKMMSSIFGLFIGGGMLLVKGDYQLMPVVQCIGVGAAFMLIPEFALGMLAAARRQKIFLALPDALDLLVVCVEAGLGLDQALRKVAEEMVKSHKTIATEFDICNKQLQMGREREEVLTELGARNGVDDLKALASIIIQADRFGSSIAQALRVQSDAMRTKRRQIAEEKASKTAVKLIFPLVLFIFPGIFVVLVGPAAITMINEMLPAFQR